MRKSIVAALVARALAGGAGAQRRTPVAARARGLGGARRRADTGSGGGVRAGLKGAPQEPTLLLGAGVAAHLLGQPESARRLLIDALNTTPPSPPHRCCSGNCLYRANDLPEAIQVYEQAQAHAPQIRSCSRGSRRGAGSRACTTPSRESWATTSPVLFEGPAEAELAAKAVEVLEAAYWRIGSALYTYPTGVLTVVLYTREQFRDITRAPEWAGGAYDGRIRMPVQGALKNPREFERVLAHEFTHALVRSLAPRDVPQWLDEGLAVNFEGSALAPHLERVRRAESRHELTTLERSFAGMDGAAATLAYSQSAAAVKRLLDEAGAAAIVGILTDLGRGLPFAEAFERNANISYAEFKKGS